MKKETVALGALLKKYLTDEGRKAVCQAKQTKAEALAAKIWERALKGEFQFVQFLADRILGKVKDSIAIEQENLRFEYDEPELKVTVVHVDDQGKQLYIEKPAMQP